MPPAKRTTITHLQEQCCHEFMTNGGNKTDAYRATHKSCAKWKDSAVWNRASELFKKPQVQEYLDELREKARKVADEKLDISTERVLKEFARIAFGDLRKLFNDDGTLKLPTELDDDTAALIESMEVVTSNRDGDVEYTHKYKTNSKVKSLENLAKYLHLFDAVVENKDQSETRCQGHTVPDWMKDLIPKSGE